MSTPIHPDRAYKIVARSVWEDQLKRQGKFTGAGVDVADGYIHLSTREQVRETANKYFKGQKDLVIIAVVLAKVHGEVKWEPSRNNDLFPHVYGHLDAASVAWIHPLTEDAAGFVFPGELSL